MMRLECLDITAGYGRSDVLESVSVALEAGEFVGLIGPNGCGKSTLLRVLSRVLPARRGIVRLQDRDMARMKPLEIARLLAFVPQQEPAAFDFTVRDIVLMGRHPHLGRFRGETQRDYDVVLRALAEADILHLADRPVTQLSGGEHRRVLLARALAQQTPLLLLDEPTAHLDITHQFELMTLVRKLTRERGVGAMAALHELNQAAEFCDRLILMSAGRVIKVGTPETVLTPIHLRAAYDAETQIGCNPVTGRPMLLALRSAREEAALANAPRVHLICGGGTGVSVMGSLARQGFRVSAGVLNRGDSDQAAGEALGIEMALELPFSPISPTAKSVCAALIAQAQTLVIAPVPFGRGNLANLELAREAQKTGKAVIILGDEDFVARDYAGGEATALLEQLLANGAVWQERIEDWSDLSLNHPLSQSVGEGVG